MSEKRLDAAYRELAELARLEFDLGEDLALALKDGVPIVRGPARSMLALGNMVALRIDSILDAGGDVVVKLGEINYQMMTGIMWRKLYVAFLERPELSPEQEKTGAALDEIERQLNKKGWSMG